MEIAQIIEWLDKHKDAIASIGLIVSGIWAFWVWKKKQAGSSTTGIQNQNSPNSGKQINAPVTANDHAAVNQHFGDTYHHYGYDDSKVAELAAKLASEFRKEDTETIKTLQETIQALTQQNAQKYDIQQALDLLAQGDTTQAEAIFAGVAAEAKQEGKKASIKEAEALRHLGSLAFLHDTQKALTAYQRSTELDPDNLDGWNNLGHLYQRIGELEKAENAYTTVQKLSLLQLNRAGEAAAYGNLGVIYWTRGELNRTIEYYEKSLVMNQELGNREGMAVNYGNLGGVYQIHGDLDRAIEYYEKALVIDEELKHKAGMACDYGNLGLVYQTRGDLECAIEFHGKALAMDEKLGHKEGMASVRYQIL